MKVLVLGSGGREHALADALSRFGHSVYCHPGNPGMLAFCHPLTEQSIALSDFSSIALLVKEHQIALTVVGPEAPLAQGIADFFEKEGLALFGPKQAAARLESSKAWAKEFMLRHSIPTAEYFLCKERESALRAAHTLLAAKQGVVVKPSGLTGGKGVVCCESLSQAEEAIGHAFGLYRSQDPVVIEEKLEGPEISLLALCDGKTLKPLLPAQDHKRLLDGGKGPNTGGVGAIAPARGWSQELLAQIDREILRPTLLGLQKESLDYRGLIYFGLMLTANGPKVLEYNCRFGDPETQALLPLLDCDLAKLMLACVEGSLPPDPIRWKPLASCCVILASDGYPEKPQTGFAIEGLERLAGRQNLSVFHGATALTPENKTVTSGGRVLGVTGVGATLEEASALAYAGVKELRFSGAHYRTDIGQESH